MDKCEIIERLKNIAEHAVYTVGEKPFIMSLDDGIAVHEAIALLEKSEMDCLNFLNKSDTIDRAEAQTAIQFAAKRYTVAHEAHGEGQVVWSDNLINVTDAMNVLRDLPSAEPDTTTHDSIPAETGENDGDRTSGDCISRQQAVDALRKMQAYKLFAGDDMLLIDQAEAQTELMMLPSARPDDDKLERCRFEYINACKIVTHPTPDTRKKDINDAYAVVRALNPIFGEEGF